MTRNALTYGAVMAAAVFLVGWLTGMGGAFLANLFFSLSMGVLAAALFVGARWLAARNRD